MNLSKYLNQKAVYWGNPVMDGFGGYTFDAPIEVDVRWTEKQELFLSSEKGATDQTIPEKLSKVVILAETDFDYKGKMMLGTLLSLTSDELPESNNALTIEAFTKIPDKNATQFLRKAWLL